MKALLIALTTLLLGTLPALAQKVPQAATPVPAPATAAPVVRMIVSVGEMGPDKSTEWRAEACADVHALANDVIASGVQITCRGFDAFHMIDTYLQQLKADNLYHIRILRGFKGAFRVSVTNWNRTLESDFNTIGWSIAREPHTTPRRKEALKNVLGNFFDYVQREQDLKTTWLLNALSLSNAINYDFKDLSFKSVKDRKKISVAQAASLFEKESPENMAYLRAREEMAAAFTVESPNIDVFGRESSLETILDKAIIPARLAADSWIELITPDEKGLSDVTIQLLTSANVPPKVDSAIFAPDRSTLSKRKAPGKLIILF